MANRFQRKLWRAIATLPYPLPLKAVSPFQSEAIAHYSATAASYNVLYHFLCRYNHCVAANIRGMNKPLDVNLSREIASRINSKANSCFDNAYKAALLIEGAMYVQGFLVCAGEPYVPIEYSWVELDERIIDPTLPHLNKDARELSYFPAQRLTIKQLKAAVEEAQEDYPDDDPLPVYGSEPYEYYGDVMLGGREYQDAYEAAGVKSNELNLPNS